MQLGALTEDRTSRMSEARNPVINNDISPSKLLEESKHIDAFLFVDME